MFHILGFIFFIVLIVLLIGFVILWRIVNTFLGLGKRMTGGANPHTQNQQHTTYQTNDDSSTQTSRNQTNTTSPSGDKKKVFADDEGEYIDFEEIKD